MPELPLHFDGPYKFTTGDASLFHSPCDKEAGVYLWTFRQHADGSHLIHYVGETMSFAKRQREHLIHILSLNYGMFDPDKAQQGISEILWPGLWRKKSADGPAECLEAYVSLNDVVRRYVEALNVFFAPTTVEPLLRKHIEGCIGWNLRMRHPEHKVLYPDDNHIGTSRDKTNGVLRITSAEPIRGLDAEIVF